MICLRCEYCCKYCCVVIVEDPSKGIHEDNLVYHKGDGTPCLHLQGDRPGKYSCALHKEPWYKDTPCFAHGQIEESKDTPCRMGVYILSKQKEKEC